MKNTAFVIIALLLCSCSQTTKNTEAQEPQIQKYYIIDHDTIAELLNFDQKARMADIRTSREYRKDDGFLVSAAIEKLVPGKSGGITFFLHHKSSDQWYASYHDGTLTIKDKPKELDLGDIHQKGIGFVNIFFATIDMAKEKMKQEAKAKLHQKLASYQKKNFPKARKEYYNHVKDQLWKKNIKVVISGKTIKFYGSMFMRNNVIDSTFEEMHEELKKLRFTKVHFGASEGINEYSYTIHSKRDEEI